MARSVSPSWSPYGRLWNMRNSLYWQSNNSICLNEYKGLVSMKSLSCQMRAPWLSGHVSGGCRRCYIVYAVLTRGQAISPTSLVLLQQATCCLWCPFPAGGLLFVCRSCRFLFSSVSLENQHYAFLLSFTLPAADPGLSVRFSSCPFHKKSSQCDMFSRLCHDAGSFCLRAEHQQAVCTKTYRIDSFESFQCSSFNCASPVWYNKALFKRKLLLILLKKNKQCAPTLTVLLLFEKMLMWNSAVWNSTQQRDAPDPLPTVFLLTTLSFLFIPIRMVNNNPA